MDGQHANFEDQFRRMVIDNGAPSHDDQNGGPAPRPTVRLPPSNAQPVQQRQQHQSHLPPHLNGSYGQHTQQQQQQSPSSNGSYQYQHPHQRQGPRVSPYAQLQATHGYAQPRPQMNGLPPNQRARHQQQVAIDPNAFQRGARYEQQQGQPGPQQLFNPQQPRAQQPFQSYGDQHLRKTQYLQQLANSGVASVEMSKAERDEKQNFRQALQKVCSDVANANPERIPQVSLECFGSFKSGFATAGSDMDLVIVVKDSSSASACFALLEDDLPRALERELLRLGYGARLLTRTRVPIIKVCEKPDSSLLSKLRAEREKWDDLPNELKYPHLHNEQNEGDEADIDANAAADTNGAVRPDQAAQQPREALSNARSSKAPPGTGEATTGAKATTAEQPPATADGGVTMPNKPMFKRDEKPFTRERKAGPLDFPKSGVGIQSDINFFNPLGLHNTHMLYCYSLCDDRVQPMVLFVKAWAKLRKINSSYSGTLSSYGHVLMVLHYLMNVASPPILPNLQNPARPPGPYTPQKAAQDVDGWGVAFWDNEKEILAAKQRGQISNNRESLGSLLAGFFQYYSSQGAGPQFVWTKQVLSLRSQGGILTKEEKEWTKAITEESEGKKIQHRFLFCIEDPFELKHNVARTVTHQGIVAIRDEFRRAGRILGAIGRGQAPLDGELFEQLVEPEEVISIAHESKSEGWQPDATDGTARSPQAMAPQSFLNSPQQQRAALPHQRPQRSQYQAQVSKPQTHTPNPKYRGSNPSASVRSPGSSSPDVKYNDAFPSLGGAGTTTGSKKPATAPKQMENAEWSEISGEQAEAVLQGLRRKKDVPESFAA